MARVATAVALAAAVLVGRAQGAVYTVELMTETMGLVQSVCDTDGEEPKVYVSFDLAAYLAPPAWPWSFSVDVPAECAPFQHLFASFNPTGHPPFDGNGGGWGTPHYDLHWYFPTLEEREVLVGSCVTWPSPIQCDLNSEDAETRAFFEVPPADYITGFFVDRTFDGAAIIGHGNHLHAVAEVDEELYCAGGSSTPPWVDCAVQEQSLYAGDAEAVDLGCRCGEWRGQTSPILVIHGGSVIANEIMPSVRQAEDILSGALTNPYTEPYPAQVKYERSYRPPTMTWSSIADGRVRQGLILRKEPVQPCPLRCAEDDLQGRRRRQLRFGHVLEDCSAC